jgi:hypothetical protein
MKSKEKGDIAVSKAVAYFVGNNEQILLPFGDKRPYDLVVERDEKFLKIQCKYTSHKNEHGMFVVPLRVMGGNKSGNTIKSYKLGDFDILFAYTTNGEQYEIPSNIWSKCKNSLTLGLKYEEYKIRN